MQFFCIWGMGICFRDSIAPSLKAIYEFQPNFQSRNSATNVKKNTKKKAPETTPAL